MDWLPDCMYAGFDCRLSNTQLAKSITRITEMASVSYHSVPRLYTFVLLAASGSILCV